MTQPHSIKVWDIHGGIHPNENKAQSTQQEIRFAGIPNELTFPVSQHIGAPATPIVKAGDKVLKGQMIAEAKGFISAPIHASTSGEVAAIENRLLPHPSGMSGLCIIIKTDGKDEWIKHQGINNYQDIEKAVLLDHIRQSGIAGMGGAGFPSAVKLSTNDKKINTLIINGTECEPYITADDVLMRERASEIIAGTKILSHLVNPQEIKIGIEDNKPEAIAALTTAAQNTNIKIVSFPTKYPSGGEKQLIQILTGKEVQSGRLPADIGIVCQNIGTTVAIYRAVEFGEPLTSRITTITGYACGEQKNLETLLGTPIQFLLDQCQFDHSKCSRLIMGGPMMGFTLESTAIPVVKTTNCILAPTSDELPPPPPAQACIRCGMCAEACPVSLLPQQMYWFSRGHEWEKLEAHNLMDCIECGACSYVCPSNIPLVQYYRASKAEIRQQKEDAIKAEQSKARFEARQQRIEQQAAEKDAKRKARKAAAEARAAEQSLAQHDGSDEKVDAIQAAIERAKAKKTEQAATDNKASVAPTVDAAQTAIEKAKAKRTSKGLDSLDRVTLEKNLATAEKRLKTAQEKYHQAKEQNSDKVDAFQLGIDKSSTKVENAKKALQQFLIDNPDTNSIPEETIVKDDAQQAIERALAKREAASTMTDEERLQNAVTALQKRLEKAEAKLLTAQQNHDENLSIFEDAKKKLELKLDDAKKALDDYQTGVNS